MDEDIHVIKKRRLHEELMNLDTLAEKSLECLFGLRNMSFELIIIFLGFTFMDALCLEIKMDMFINGEELGLSSLMEGDGKEKKERVPLVKAKRRKAKVKEVGRRKRRERDFFGFEEFLAMDDID